MPRMVLEHRGDLISEPTRNTLRSAPGARNSVESSSTPKGSSASGGWYRRSMLLFALSRDSDLTDKAIRGLAKKKKGTKRWNGLSAVLSAAADADTAAELLGNHPPIIDTGAPGSPVRAMAGVSMPGGARDTRLGFCRPTCVAPVGAPGSRP